MFAWVLDAILKFAPAYRKLGGDVVDAPMRVYAAWRVVRDSLPDPEPMIIHCGSPHVLLPRRQNGNHLARCFIVEVGLLASLQTVEAPGVPNKSGSLLPTPPQLDLIAHR